MKIQVQNYGHPGTHPASMIIPENGTTVNRPTEGLFIGYPYFDTDLGYMVHYDGVGWVNGVGTLV